MSCTLIGDNYLVARKRLDLMTKFANDADYTDKRIYFY